MNTEKANKIVEEYNSKKKHTMGEKAAFFKARTFLRNEALKIHQR